MVAALKFLFFFCVENAKKNNLLVVFSFHVKFRRSKRLTLIPLSEHLDGEIRKNYLDDMATPNQTTNFEARREDVRVDILAVERFFLYVHCLVI